MSNRESIRAAMDAEFVAFPDWVKSHFLPFRETLTILFDKRLDELARSVIAAIPQPASATAEELAEFNQAQSSVLTGIDLLIADFNENDPLRSPENIALRELADQRRAQE